MFPVQGTRIYSSQNTPSSENHATARPIMGDSEKYRELVAAISNHREVEEIRSLLQSSSLSGREYKVLQYWAKTVGHVDAENLLNVKRHLER